MTKYMVRLGSSVGYHKHRLIFYFFNHIFTQLGADNNLCRSGCLGCSMFQQAEDIGSKYLLIFCQGSVIAHPHSVNYSVSIQYQLAALHTYVFLLPLVGAKSSVDTSETTSSKTLEVWRLPFWNALIDRYIEKTD